MTIQVSDTFNCQNTAKYPLLSKASKVTCKMKSWKDMEKNAIAVKQKGIWNVKHGWTRFSKSTRQTQTDESLST